MARIFVSVLLATVVFVTTAPKAFAADYSTELPLLSGTINEEFDSFGAVRKGPSFGVTLDTENEAITLKQNSEGEYVSLGKVVSKNMESHFQYTQSASITMTAEIPEGTSIDLYLMKIDGESVSVYSSSHSFVKVDPGVTYTIGAFSHHISASENQNKLRWKAVLKTEDPSKTPVLHAIAMNYVNATPKANQITFLHRVFNVNRTPGATIKITIFGNGFREGQEQVYVKNLFEATSVTFIDSETLVAELPIDGLGAGSFTIVVRNTETSRLALTDGYPLLYASNGAYPPEETRLILQ